MCLQLTTTTINMTSVINRISFNITYDKIGEPYTHAAYYNNINLVTRAMSNSLAVKLLEGAYSYHNSLCFVMVENSPAFRAIPR